MTNSKPKEADVLSHLSDLHLQALKECRYLPLHWVSSPESWREVLVCSASWASPSMLTTPLPDGMVGIFDDAPVYEDRTLDRHVLELRNEADETLVSAIVLRDPH